MARNVSWMMLSCVCLCGLLTGCQSTVGGQTLPSAYYLRDDVQYFPAGPEFVLTKTVEAQEQYKLEQQGFNDRTDTKPGKPRYDQ